jgi:hypothetical protein
MLKVVMEVPAVREPVVRVIVAAGAGVVLTAVMVQLV